MLIEAKVYKGIEYVQLSELPADQQNLITKSFNKDFIIKIQVNGKILGDCIQFKYYEAWYAQQFPTQVHKSEKQEIKVADNPVSSKELVAENFENII